MQYPLGGAVEILVLPAFERPHEGCERRQAEAERDRYQVESNPSFGGLQNGRGRKLCVRGRRWPRSFAGP